MALTPNSVTTFDKALQIRYERNRKLERLGTTRTPTLNQLAPLTRRGRAGGRKLSVAVNTGNAGSPGHNYAKVRNSTVTAKFEEFLVPREKLYQIIGIEGELMMAAAEGDPDSRMSIQSLVEGAQEQARMKFEHRFFRDSGGSTGKIDASTNVATDQLILEDMADVLLMQENTALAFGPNKDGTSLRNSGATLTVTAINAATKTLTMSANINTVTGTQAGDFVFRDGDAGASWTGLEDWISSAAAPPVLHGVPRTTDRERLAGQTYAQNGEDLDVFLYDVLAEMETRGPPPDVFVMAPLTFAKLSKHIYSRSFRTKLNGPTGLFSQAVTYESRGGQQITCMKSPFCQKDKVWPLRLSSWSVYTVTPKIPSVVDKDGSMFHRSELADEYEVRAGNYGNFACWAPYHNAHLTLDA